MKKLIMLCAMAGALFFTACDNDNDDDRVLINDYNNYVDRVGSDTSIWYSDDSYWNRTGRNYDSLDQQVNVRYEQMDEPSRSRVDSIRTRYNTYKSEYATGIEVRKQQAELNSASTVINNILGADMSSDVKNVNASNILAYYQRFVNAVAVNKDSYTPAQWDAIKAWYEKLDARKNIVEKEGLKGADNLKIAELKVRYNTIRVPGRIDSKFDEKVKESEYPSN